MRDARTQMDLNPDDTERRISRDGGNQRS